MMNGRLDWHGDEVQKTVLAMGWERIRRAAGYFLERIRDAISVSNPRVTVRSKGKSFSTNPTPSKPGEPPRLRTGFLLKNTIAEYDEATMTARVGVTANAKYGLFLEVGTRGGQTIVPRTKKALAFFAGGAMRFARRVTKGPMQARPFIMSTLHKFWDQIAALAGSGDSGSSGS